MTSATGNGRDDAEMFLRTVNARTCGTSMIYLGNIPDWTKIEVAGQNPHSQMCVSSDTVDKSVVMIEWRLD